ncbi:MAG: EF2563 family selenium-dependent molybdenum hydroxylase system protein [Clostridium sp.]|nr:EF2563 family selenium-dependent molybdenum hydroxylase system protein [Clostridium sp.]
MTHNLVIVRGGGDIATGVTWALRNAGFDVLILESESPSAIRTAVSFSEAVYAGESTVEGMRCVREENFAAALDRLRQDGLALLIDPCADTVRYFSAKSGWRLGEFHLVALVDAVIAKKNMGTGMEMAPFVAALGPGFTAGEDCDMVIETMRGHSLGRLILAGTALPDTGIPGTIAGHSRDRVLHAPADGVLRQIAHIGDVVEKDSAIAEITSENGERTAVRATFTGLLRGLIHEGYRVKKGMKIADIDPRTEERENCFSISDKSRSLGGAALLAVMMSVSGQYRRLPEENRKDKTGSCAEWE